MRLLKITVACVFLGMLSTACSSLDHAMFQDEPIEMYGGTKYSWDYITNNTTEETTVVGNLAYTLDFPFTVIMDTLLLPISAPMQLTR